MTTGALTIQDNDTVDQYIAVGESTFVFNFPILENDELKVSRNQVLLTFGVDYSISGLGDDGGGYITLLLGASTPGDVWTLWQDMPIERLTSFSAGAAAILGAALNAEFSARLRVEQQLRREIRNSVRIPPDDPIGSQDMVLPANALRAGRYFAFDALGKPIMSTGTGNDSALRVDLANSVLGVEGSRLVGYRSPGTGAIATSVYAVLRGLFHVSMFGAVGDGVTDDRAAVQAAIDAANAAGGGEVVCDWGRNYRLVCGGPLVLTIQACAQVKQGVALNLNKSTLSCELGDGNQCAVWLFGDRTSVQNGTINVVSVGALSSQGFFGPCVSVGLPNNMGDTVASPSAGQFMKGWSVRNLSLSTVGVRRPTVGVIGGASLGLIEEINIPDSATSNGIFMDWGNLGTVSSSAIATTRASFDAGTAYTTHPHNIKIRNIRAGTLSAALVGDLGTAAVRLSACYGVEVENVEIVSGTLGAVFHTGGDLGFEFAPVNVKRHACKGNRFRNITVLNPTASMPQGMFLDTLADNVYREQFISGYVPLMNPLLHGDVEVDGCRLMGPNIDSTYGVRITQGRGIKIRHTQAQRWKHGVFVDEFTQDIDIEDCDITQNRNEGIKVGQQLLREGTERIYLRRNKVYQNGTDTAGNDIRVTRGKLVILEKNLVGFPGTTQTAGIGVDDAHTLRNIQLIGNHCLGATVAAYGLVGSSPVDALKYRVVTAFRDNTAENVPTITAGLTYIPVQGRAIGASRQQSWLNPNSAAPGDGIWYRGDDLDQSDPAAAAQAGHKVTTSGTFGALASITNGATTNGVKDITCSLAGLTANTTATAYSIVISSAASIRRGMKISIPAVGIANAEVIDISGTTLQLDTQANATLGGTAVVACGLIEGEVISINTTTPVTQAVVMKINGATVTLDRAPVDTQGGRTVTYTVPVFKTRANLAA